MVMQANAKHQKTLCSRGENPGKLGISKIDNFAKDTSDKALHTKSPVLKTLTLEAKLQVNNTCMKKHLQVNINGKAKNL
jgi:hypothetical protein